MINQEFMSVDIVDQDGDVMMVNVHSDGLIYIEVKDTHDGGSGCVMLEPKELIDALPALRAITKRVEVEKFKKETSLRTERMLDEGN